MNTGIFTGTSQDRHVRCPTVRGPIVDIGETIVTSIILSFLLLAIAPLAGAQARSASAGPRIALLIANGSYQSPVDRLNGPLSDGVTLRKALQSAGFVGIEGELSPTLLADGNLAQMRQKLIAFRSAMQAAGPFALGILYFAGHGGANATGTENYILSVDTPDVRVSPVEKHGLGVYWIANFLGQLDAERRPNIAIIIDACRTPQGDSTARARGGASVHSMVKPDHPLPRGMMVALSTGVGQTAPDTGPYAEVLAEAITTSRGVPIESLFSDVMRNVAQKTKNAQIPVHQSQIIAKVCIGICVDVGAGVDIRDAMRCTALRPDDLSLAIRARNEEKVVEVIQCRRDFLSSSEVRAAIAAHFRIVDFGRSESFLTRLRQRGIRILADFRPMNPDRAEEYGSSPLRIALEEWNIEAISWLSAGGEADAWAAYPALLALRFRRLPVGDPQQQARAVSAVVQAVKAGLPTDFNDYEAFRLTYRAWLQTQIGPEMRALGAGSRTREWDSLFGDARPSSQADYWWSLSKTLQPVGEQVRAKVLARVQLEFARPRIEGLNRMEENLKQMLVGRGLRTIVDPRHPLGGRNVDVPAGALQDDDVVVDGYGLLSADGWAPVSRVKATIRAIAHTRQQLVHPSAFDSRQTK